MSPIDHVRALEDAGFADAADVLRKLKEQEPETNKAAAVTPAPPLSHEQARRQEGEALLSALHKAVPSLRPGSDEQ